MTDIYPHHNHNVQEGEGRLVFSILLNLLITLAEVAGGILSGSLALLSDALHNFSDSASLAISLVSLRISKREADRKRTFGYRRAQIIGAFVNLITLVIVALYLIKEAIERYLNPEPIDGTVMFVVAVVGLLANVITAILLRRFSKESLNIKSAFLHILSDAFSSVGVILGSLLILQFRLFIVDTILTFLISVYILFYSSQLLRQTIRILMQSMPEGFEFDQILRDVRSVEGVQDIHHMHVWQLDEAHTNLEAHIVINTCDYEDMQAIKQAVKERLVDRYGISHSTLEFEFMNCENCEPGSCYEITTVKR